MESYNRKLRQNNCIQLHELKIGYLSEILEQVLLGNAPSDILLEEYVCRSAYLPGLVKHIENKNQSAMNNLRTI